MRQRQQSILRINIFNNNASARTQVQKQQKSTMKRVYMFHVEHPNEVTTTLHNRWPGPNKKGLLSVSTFSPPTPTESLKTDPCIYVASPLSS